MFFAVVVVVVAVVIIVVDIAAQRKRPHVCVRVRARLRACLNELVDMNVWVNESFMWELKLKKKEAKKWCK